MARMIYPLPTVKVPLWIPIEFLTIWNYRYDFFAWNSIWKAIQVFVWKSHREHPLVRDKQRVLYLLPDFCCWPQYYFWARQPIRLTTLNLKKTLVLNLTTYKTVKNKPNLLQTNLTQTVQCSSSWSSSSSSSFSSSSSLTNKLIVQTQQLQYYSYSDVIKVEILWTNKLTDYS